MNITRRIRFFFLLALAVFAAAGLWVAWTGRCTGVLEVHFLDIGQGDAIYIRVPNGNDLLIDAGPSPSVLRRLGEAMPWRDRGIDVLLETHPDQDHIGGFPDVIERYRIGMFVMPGVESANTTDDEIGRLVADRGIPTMLARRGQRIALGGGAYLDVLFPYGDVSGLETNDASIVARLSYGQTAFMLTGDSPKKVEERLVRLDGADLQSDVLKAGHHGSKTSSGEAFVSAVRPDFAVISAGIDNRYGHPNQETLDTFEGHGISISRTDQDGTIVFKSDGAKVWREE